MSNRLACIAIAAALAFAAACSQLNCGCALFRSEGEASYWSDDDPAQEAPHANTVP